MTLSTYPTALAATSTYNMQLSISLSPFTPPADYDYVLTSPKPQILEKSPLGTVSAEVSEAGVPAGPPHVHPPQPCDPNTK